MAIPETLINQIRERVDIVEVIDSYIPLKKAGRNFKALCPFHPEKTPSFYVSPEKQIFHCFGCGQGGNVFHFLIKYQNISFLEAVREVADIVGIEIKEEKTDSLSKKIQGLNQLAMEFYSQMLKSKPGEKCREYLKSRGISQQVIDLFQLGYAPPSWDSLLNFLSKKNYRQELLLKAGLIVESKEGRSFYDLFRDRLIFPISDSKGKVLGFGGRALSEEAMPKYLNSPETPLYKKGKLLYGINITFPQIAKERMAIIVEGYFDMLSLYQAGITNVAASLGTALTPEQIRFLKKYLDEVVIVYDGDPAGQMASLRGLDIVFESGIKAKAVMLPAGYDPDSYVREKGKDEFLKLLEQRKEVFDYKLEALLKLYGKESLDSRIKVVDEMFSSLNKVGDYLRKTEHMRKLAEQTGFEERILWEQYFSGSKTREGRPRRVRFEAERMLSQKNYHPVESTLLYLMLTQTDLIPELKEILSAQEFLTPCIQKLVEKIYSHYSQKGELNLGNFLNLLPEDERMLLSEIMAQDLEFNPDVFDRFFTECVAKLKILRIERYCKFLEDEIKRAQESADLKRANVLLKELSQIKKKELKL